MSTAQNFADEMLDAAFPFFIACDRDLRVKGVGRSLSKLLDRSPIDQPLAELVSIQKPRLAMDFDSIAKASEQLYLLKLNNHDASLRGQVLCQAKALVFLVSLRCDDPSKLAELGITVSDYANHDSGIETLFLQQAQSTQLTDLHTMVAKLKQAAEDKEHFQAAENALAHDLQAAGDLSVRFDQSMTIIDIRSSNASYVDADLEHVAGRPMSETLPTIAEVVQPIVRLNEDWSKPIPVEFELITESQTYYFEARLAKTLRSNFLLMGRDVSDRQQLERRLEHRALHDPLTNLANRSLFQRNVQAAQAMGKNIAVMIADVNDFKSINDRMGHHVGDALLLALAERMCSCSRSTDTVARLGGDEFGLLLTGVDSAENAYRYATRIVNEIARPVRVHGCDIEPRISIGIAFDDSARPLEELLRDADFAMYKAKQQERSHVAICDDSVRQAIMERMETKHDLVQAIRNQEFVPFYQPIMDLKTRTVSGFEALVRWRHPKRGLLTPFSFIDIAEENGMITDLGEIVLQTACRDIQGLNAMFPTVPIRVNVNLAPRQLQDQDLTELVEQTLCDSHLGPKNLTLEITETALIDDLPQAQVILQKLRQQGICIALDDFGSGYSSLNYLQQFPIDSLKLDRSLISNICVSEDQLSIVKCVMQLGNTLGMKVVAEGIETREQAAAVTKLGCDYGQGYLFAKPMPISQVTKLLESQTAKREPLCTNNPGLFDTTCFPIVESTN